MSLGILQPTSTAWRCISLWRAHEIYADPDWWGDPSAVVYEWRYHPLLVAAAKVLQRRWRVRRGLRWAKAHLHWSEVSRGHLRWRESGSGWEASREERECERPNARDGKWSFAEVFTATKVRNKTRIQAESDKADKMLLAAAYGGNEGLVRQLLQLPYVNLDCVEAYSSPSSNASVLHMPLDVAVRNGHGEIACWILEKAGSGTMLRGMHPECVPSACSPRGLLTLCDKGASHLFTEWNTPTLNVRYQQVRQRRALAKAVHTLLQSSHVVGTTLPDRQNAHLARQDEHGNFMYRYWLVDARMPGALMGNDPQGWVYTDSLLSLAWWAEHTDLAARLYLAGVRCRPPKPPRRSRFVARAVVRTLLRRHVKMRLIAWYWAEAAVKAKYAAPDAAGFEEDMAAPVFCEGALGA